MVTENWSTNEYSRGLLLSREFLLVRSLHRCDKHVPFHCGLGGFEGLGNRLTDLLKGDGLSCGCEEEWGDNRLITEILPLNVVGYSCLCPCPCECVRACMRAFMSGEYKVMHQPHQCTTRMPCMWCMWSYSCTQRHNSVNATHSVLTFIPFRGWLWANHSKGTTWHGVTGFSSRVGQPGHTGQESGALLWRGGAKRRSTVVCRVSRVESSTGRHIRCLTQAAPTSIHISPLHLDHHLHISSLPRNCSWTSKLRSIYGQFQAGML